MLFLNVGRKGSGKTTRTKRLLNKWSNEQRKVILDVNDEYRDVQNALICQSFDEILKETETTNNVFVFEEATIFFSHHVKASFFDFLVKQRHKNNDLIFNFHSIRTMPLYLLDFSDYVLLGKTNDIPEFVKSKFNGHKLVYFFEKVNADSNDFAVINFKVN